MLSLTLIKKYLSFYSYLSFRSALGYKLRSLLPRKEKQSQIKISLIFFDDSILINMLLHIISSVLWADILWSNNFGSFFMNPTSNQEDQGQPKNCQTYFDLIVKAGSKGKYQYLLTFIFTLTWYVTGTLLLSTSFTYSNPSFDCEAFGLLTDSCYDYVCSLPSSAWPNFVTEDAQSFKSLATAFDNYFCDDQFYLNLHSSGVYLGALLGYIFNTFLSDNFGRRKITIIAWGICTVGCIILVSAQSMIMATIGFFLCGFGSDSILGITTSVMVETYQDNMRQKHCTIIQMAFTSGGLVTTLFYYIWQDWRITSIYALTLPSAITLILIIIYVKETPMYLIKEDPDNALNVLNKIGKMNKKEQQCVQAKDIQDVMAFQQTAEYNKMSTFFDVFRYASLRGVTIAQGLVSMATYLMYYGPTLIVSQFGFDIYTSETALNISDIIVYYPSMLIIDKIKRRKLCTILFLIATIVSGVLIFLTKPKDCDNCATIFIQLALVFVFRFCISMQFTIMLVYQSQIYPTRVRNIAGGVLGVFGTVCSTLSPILMGLLTRGQINHFILFTCLGVVAIGSYMVCPETYQKICPEEIEEVQYEKRKKTAKKSFFDQEKLHKY